MLTREFLMNADCQSAFGAIDQQLLLTPEQRNASLSGFLDALPSGVPVRVFGYGSLMWNPALDYSDVRPARLDGWHRAFCIRLIAGRGTGCTPGRMLALKAGGHTRGLVFRLSDRNPRQELELLWKREMLTGCYLPRWQHVTLDDGEQVIALVFTMNTAHPLFEADDCPSVVAPLIAAARGPLGSNAQYLFELMNSLTGLGVQDDRLLTLARDVRELQQTSQR